MKSIQVTFSSYLLELKNPGRLSFAFKRDFIKHLARHVLMILIRHVPTDCDL